jgi:hypothetical protein
MAGRSVKKINFEGRGEKWSWHNFVIVFPGRTEANYNVIEKDGRDLKPL